jgi:hypothetical protein
VFEFLVAVVAVRMIVSFITQYSRNLYFFGNYRRSRRACHSAYHKGAAGGSRRSACFPSETIEQI